MSWSAGQQRTLDRIEKTLIADDQRLGSLFAFFAMLAGDAAMPRTERVCVPPSLPMRSALIAAAGLITAAVVLLTVLAPGGPSCPAMAVTTSALSSSATRLAAGCHPGSPATRSSPDRLGRAGAPAAQHTAGT